MVVVVEEEEVVVVVEEEVEEGLSPPANQSQRRIRPTRIRRNAGQSTV